MGPMRPAQHSRRFRTALVAAAAGALLVGCGANDSSSTAAETTSSPSASSPSASSPSATSTTPAGCDDVAALRSSMQALTEIRPLRDGLDATEQAVTDAKDSLETAVTSIGEELKPAVGD